MKTRVLLPALLTVGLLTLASASQVQAFELLNRMVGGHHGPSCGCEPTCAAPICEPTCAAPVCEPACGCEPTCCAPKKPLFHGLFKRLHAPRCHAVPACGCEPTCAAPVCEPTCAAPVCEPACGCEPACCGPKFSLKIKRPKLFGHLFKKSCCEPACGCEPACEPACGCEPVCEPACGCEPSCGA